MALDSNEIAIVNLALFRIGVSTVIAVGGATNENRVAEVVFPIARDFVLSEYPWPFATKRAALAGQATSTVTNWAYSFTLPSGCLRALRVLDAQASPRRDEDKAFQLLDGKVYTDTASATLEYIDQITTAASFNPAFKNLLGFYLAAELATALKARPELAKGAFDAYQAAKKELPATGVPSTKVSQVDGTAAASQLKFCNTALISIGYPDLIASISEASNAARAMQAIYQPSLHQILRQAEWPFATRRAALVASATEPPDCWGYAYDLPSDYLHALWLTNTAIRTPSEEQKVQYEIVWKHDSILLVTDVSPAELCYVTSDIVEAQMDPLFVDAFQWMLAAKVGPILKADPKLVAMAQNNFFMAISRARAVALSEGKGDPEPDGLLISSRIGGASSTSSLLSA